MKKTKVNYLFMILNIKSIKFINKFSCPAEIKDKSYRCDLHPRIISENEIIIFNQHEGIRGIYSIKI